MTEMTHLGSNIMNSLADAASGICGFKVYNTQHGLSLVAEWSHSLNMLDIDICSIYEEVCEGLATDNGTVDVVVLCDRTKIFIGFFVSLRNSTQFKTVDNVATFYAIKGTIFSSIVIQARVWEDMVVDGVQAMLHVDTHSRSCSFHFHKDKMTRCSITKSSFIIATIGVLLFTSVLLRLLLDYRT